MNTYTQRIDRFSRRIAIAALAAILVGGVIVFVGIGLDWGGFLGGLALGGGIGLVVVGAYFMGYAHGVRNPVSRRAWLPSQDAGA